VFVLRQSHDIFFGPLTASRLARCPPPRSGLGQRRCRDLRGFDEGLHAATVGPPRVVRHALSKDVLLDDLGQVLGRKRTRKRRVGCDLGVGEDDDRAPDLWGIADQALEPGDRPVVANEPGEDGPAAFTRRQDLSDAEAIRDQGAIGEQGRGQALLQLG
jgi:hypothetical protein